MKRYSAALGLVAGFALLPFHSLAQSGQRLELTSPGETIVLEPYAPNILRVTLSKDAVAAKAGPGFGFVAKPNAAGWSANQSDSQDVYKSDRVVFAAHRPHPDPDAPKRVHAHSPIAHSLTAPAPRPTAVS